jgi:hypothetical protein
MTCSLRAIRIASVPLLLTLTFASTSHGQRSCSEGLPRWDSSNQTLFCVEGSGRVHRIFTGSAGADLKIDMLRELRNARAAYVDGVTESSDGKVIVAATVIGDKRRPRGVVLTYTQFGMLESSWTNVKLSASAIAYAADSNSVLVLGESHWEPWIGGPDGHLLIEYAPDGTVIREMLDHKTFANEDPLNMGSEVGIASLRVTPDRIYVYAPDGQEAVALARNGDVLQHRRIGDAVKKLAEAGGFRLVQTHAVDFDEDGNVLVDLLIWNEDSAEARMRVLRVNLASGESGIVHESVGPEFQSFVGVKDGRSYLYSGRDGALFVQTPSEQTTVPLFPDAAQSVQNTQ